MPDRKEQRWFRERECTLFLPPLCISISLQQFFLSTPTFSAALRIHLPHSSNAYATVALFLWGRLWGKRDWKSRWEGMMEIGGRGVQECCLNTLHTSGERQTVPFWLPLPPCVPLFFSVITSTPHRSPTVETRQTSFSDWCLLQTRYCCGTPNKKVT